MNDPDKQTVVESQDCHLRPVVQRLVDALRKQRQVEDDQSRIADLQQDAFNEELLFVDIFNRSVGVFLVFDVRKSNGEGREISYNPDREEKGCPSREWRRKEFRMSR